MPLTDLQLRVQNVHAIYNHSVVALRGINLTLHRGEIVALIGSNGAGKTTTLKAISHLLPAERGRVTTGSIHFEGQDVLHSTPCHLVRQGLAQVLEGRHCFRTLTVEENLVTGALARGEKQAWIASQIEKIYTIFPRLRDKRKAFAGLISGGEQQMTAIGRALMSRPRLLVLDEPSMGLAPKTVQSIFEALRQINETERLSLLIAEQNSAIALRYAHRAVVLENGTSVLESDAAELRRRSDIKAFYLGRELNAHHGASLASQTQS